ncbi:hypothetical protein EJB05_11511, partial [Eragrostis curvula]
MAASPRVRHEQAETLADPHAVVTNDGVLPTDLLTEILLRVPAKPLCRLRLVCRSWRSLTSDPRFARTHSSRHPLFAGRSPSKDKEEYEIHIFDMSGNIVKRMCGLGDLAMHLSTQADLVCVKRYTGNAEEDPDLLLNPATGAIHVLPGVSVSCIYATCFLGHVPSTGEYKVLRVCLQHSDGVEVQHAYEVVTLDDGSGQSWRVHVTPCPPPPTRILPYTGFMVIIREIAYVVSLLHGLDIVLFHLVTEEWRPTVVRGPCINLQDSESIELFELNGCLVIGNHNNKNEDCSMDLWFLVDVDKGLWTKRYSILCGPNWKYHTPNPPCPLVVLDDGRLVVGYGWALILRAFDPRTCSWEDLAELPDPEDSIGLYKGNLLCPGLSPMPSSHIFMALRQ